MVLMAKVLDQFQCWAGGQATRPMYDLICLWESANGHTLLSDPDTIRTEGPDSGALMKLSHGKVVLLVFILEM